MMNGETRRNKMDLIENYVVDRLHELEATVKAQEERIEALADKIEEFEEMRELLQKNLFVKHYVSGEPYIDHRYGARKQEVATLIAFYGLTDEEDEEE